MKATSENKTASTPGFYFVGEHAALDFANTVLDSNGLPVEMLGSYADVLRWLKAAPLSDPTDKPDLPHELPAGPAEALLLKQIRELRSLWKAALGRLVAGKDLSPELLNVLNRHLQADLNWRQLSHPAKSKAYEIRQVHAPLDPSRKILAVLSAQLADFLAHANLDFLRQCAGSGCVLYFYDTTKNHRRQWCSMAACGNRHKVAAFRKRQI